MDRNNFFSHLDSAAMAEFVDTANRLVVYAGPGIQILPAQAMVAVSERIGVEMLTVNLDVDERVMRMGYGEIDAIKLLQEKGITINHTPQLRSALLIVDDQGFSFTPTALYLEAEANDPAAYNAIRLTSEQVKEALARLSPVAKAIAVAQAESGEDKQRLNAIALDIASKKLDQKYFSQVKQKLTEAPPVKFDVARQVRVYEPYLQYVEMSLTGASIQRHRLAIPDFLQETGGSNKEVEARLHTTFDLIDKDGPLSSKPLEDLLNEIRTKFTPSLGKEYGRMLLKSDKPRFEEHIEEFREALASYAKQVSEELQVQINNSKSSVIEYYLPLVEKNPPPKLADLVACDPTKSECERWIAWQLDRVFPAAEQVIKTMKLEVRYKDVTYETLSRDDFLSSVKAAFPLKDWCSAHKEFIAAKES